MQIIENKALLVSVDDPSAIIETIFRSASTRNGALVYWGHREAEKLATLGFDPPSPILRDYQWTGKLTPFEHQKNTASFLSCLLYTSPSPRDLGESRIPASG